MPTVLKAARRNLTWRLQGLEQRSVLDCACDISSKPYVSKAPNLFGKLRRGWSSFPFRPETSAFHVVGSGGAPAVASGPKDKHLPPRFPPLFSTCLTFGMPKYPRKVSQSQKATLPEKGQFQEWQLACWDLPVIAPK